MPKKRPMRTAWERIREALIEAGYEGTQPEAAKILGIKQPSVSEWNTPGKGPKLEHARNLALELNVCVDWLLTERQPKRPGPPTDPVAQELWNLWGRLSQEERHQVLGFAAAKARPTRPPATRTPKKAVSGGP